MDDDIDDFNAATWQQAQDEEHQQYEALLAADPGYNEWLNSTR